MWNIYRHNGEWVGQVEAPDPKTALRRAWAKYFGCPEGRERDDGTLRVVRVR